MTKLKLKGAKKLESLNLTGRALESLDLSTNTQLEEVYLGWGTKLSTLDLSSNKKLKTFECLQDGTHVSGSQKSYEPDKS